ncbi:hypothetical protein ACFVYR_04255 [Streptomyces sp. NPDC058284]|uniref:hypothetical protein n=1 Tax=unclassified Streptomyces TaxID=2593676 RepID=UPI00364C1543
MTMEEARDDCARQNVTNDMSGNAFGISGQFGNIYGDVHFHGPNSVPHPSCDAPKQDEDIVGAKRKKREAAERARQRLEAEDNKAIKGCGLLVLVLAAPGFAVLGYCTHDWTTAAVLVGIAAALLFLWGGGLVMRGR